MPETSAAGKITREGRNFLSQAWENALPADACTARERLLREAAGSAGICVFTQTADLIYAEAENLPACLRAKWREGCAEEDLFPAETAAEMRHIKQQILAGSAPAELDVKLPAAAETAAVSGRRDVWLRFTIKAWRDAGGALLGIMMAGTDISALRARDSAMQSLLREVSHRSKNLLAIIQSIAAQTARFSPDVGDFLIKFQGRLQSLAASQDLITAADWHGARLRDLMRAQMRCCPNIFKNGGENGNEAEVKLIGENPHLQPAAALHIGLALHELIADSAAFGALAQGEGSIALSCDDNDKNIAIKWTENFPASPESDTEKTGAKQEKQFGKAVLERIVPSAVEGFGKYSAQAGRIEYILTISSRSVSE